MQETRIYRVKTMQLHIHIIYEDCRESINRKTKPKPGYFGEFWQLLKNHKLLLVTELIFCNNSKASVKSYWLFINGTRVMLISHFAYKKYSIGIISKMKLNPKGLCTLSLNFLSEMFARWKINRTSCYVNPVYTLSLILVRHKFGSGSILGFFCIHGKHFERCFDSSEPP